MEHGHGSARETIQRTRPLNIGRNAWFSVLIRQRSGRGAQRKGMEEHSHPKPRVARPRPEHGEERAPGFSDGEHHGTLPASGRPTPSSINRECARTWINCHRYRFRAAIALTLTAGKTPTFGNAFSVVERALLCPRGLAMSRQLSVDITIPGGLLRTVR